MGHEYVNHAILSVSMVAALLGVTMLAAGKLLAIGPLLVGVLGFAYLKTDTAQVGRWPGSSGGAVADNKEEALAVLRQRYARGDIDQAEFERRLTDLLETETVEHAKEHRDETSVTERTR